MKIVLRLILTTLLTTNLSGVDFTKIKEWEYGDITPYLSFYTKPQTDFSGNIYGFDFKSCDLYKFDKDFNLLKTVKKHGYGPGELINPIILIVQDNYFIINDHKQQIINFYNFNLDFIKSVNFSKNFVHIERLDSRRFICSYLTPVEESGRVVRYNEIGIFDDSFQLQKRIHSSRGLAGVPFTIDRVCKKIYIANSSTNIDVVIFNFNGELIGKKKISKRSIRVSKIERSNNIRSRVLLEKRSYKEYIQDIFSLDSNRVAIVPAVEVIDEQDLKQYPIEIYNHNFDLIDRINFLNSRDDDFTPRTIYIENRKLYMTDYINCRFELYQLPHNF